MTISRLVLNLHGFEDRKRKVTVHVRGHARRNQSETRLDDTACEVSFTSEGIEHETARLTTQISLYSTLLTRAMDGLEVEISLKERGVVHGSDASTITAVTGSSCETASSYSTHNDQESAWFDGEESDIRESIGDRPQSEVEDDRPGVRRLSRGHGVWWVK